MVQEVKVQSSNFAAEYGSGAMNVSAVTKAGSSQFHGTLYDYSRSHKFAANDRSNSIAGVKKPESSFQYPGGNIGGPIIIPGTDFNKNRDKLFFFAGIEVQRQQVDSGARFGTVPTAAQRSGDFSEFLTANGQNFGQGIGCFNNAGGGGIKNQSEAPSACLSSGGFPGMIIPRGFPGAGGMVPGANLNNVPGLLYADRQGADEPLPEVELLHGKQPVQLRVQHSRSDEPARDEVPLRLEHHQQHQGLRPYRARQRDGQRRAWCVVGRVRRRAAVAERGHEPRPVVTPATWCRS